MADNAQAASPRRLGTEKELETLCDELLGYKSSLGNVSSLYWLSDRVLERLRIEPSGALGVLTTGLAAGLPTMAVAFVVAAAAGQWGSAPVWRWVVVSLWIAASVMFARLSYRGTVVEQFAMERALTEPADLRRHIAWIHRWMTMRKGLVFGASYALLSLVIVGLVAGVRSLASVPAGSIAMLAVVFSQMGEITYGSLLWIFAMRLESEFDFRVYWPSPLDSPWVRPALRGQVRNEFLRGLVVTGNIIIVAVLLAPESPLLLPATIVLISTGYAAILASIVVVRRCFHQIGARAKEAHLVEVRTRIDAFGERLTALDAAQLGELTRLLELYDAIHRSPTNLRAVDGVTRLVASLALPTVTFVITVVAQEYFGRIVGKVLP